MELAYVAHSQRCALLLDGEGVCRWVVPKVDAEDPSVDVAKRCMGAQFVASLDPEVEGLLGHQPRVGVTLLFAAVKDGRVSLVRFGPLLGFDTLDAATSAQLMAENIELATAHDEAQEEPEADVALAPSRPDISPLTVRAPQPITEEPITAAAPSTPSLPVVPSLPATPRVEAALSEQSPVSVDVENPFGKISSPAVASFLKDIAEIADAPYSKPATTTSDDVARSQVVADGDQLTTTFARASSLEDLFTDLSDFETHVPTADDSEIEITGAFARDEEPNGEPTELEASLDDDDDDRAPTVQRPSGFMMRAARPMDEFTASDLLDDPIFEPVLDMDQATSRFARLSGSESAHVAYKELAHKAPAPSNEPRRGILPRRSSR